MKLKKSASTITVAALIGIATPVLAKESITAAAETEQAQAVDATPKPETTGTIAVDAETPAPEAQAEPAAPKSASRLIEIVFIDDFGLNILLNDPKTFGVRAKVGILNEHPERKDIA